MGNNSIEIVKNIVSQVNFDEKKYNKFLLEMLDLKLSGKDLTYSDFVKYNSHSSKIDINTNELEDFCELIYMHWRKEIDSDRFCNNEKNIEILNEIKNNKNFSMESAKQNGYLNTLISISEEIHFHKEDRQYWKKFNLMNNQNFFEEGSSNINKDGDFLHIFNASAWDEIPDVRLYLNLKTQNFIKVAKELYQISLNKNFPLYLKFCVNDERNDNFVIYSNYKNVQYVIDALKNIKSVNPKLFDGCDKFNPLLGNIENFIGFGEQPQYKMQTSFMLEREEAVFNLISNEINRSIFSYFLDEDVNEVVLNAIAKVLCDKISVENKSNNKILFDAISKKISENIEDIADDYFCQVEGKTIDNVYMKEYSLPQGSFVIKKFDIDSFIGKNCVYDDLKDNILDREVQEEYFTKNHISTKKPFLNTETQDELNLLKENEKKL